MSGDQGLWRTCPSVLALAANLLVVARELAEDSETDCACYLLLPAAGDPYYSVGCCFAEETEARVGRSDIVTIRADLSDTDALECAAVMLASIPTLTHRFA